MNDILIVSLVGLATTSSAMAGTAIGLYWSLSKRTLACILAFAAGALISALAIDLAYHGAVDLHHAGFSHRSAWAFIGGGFAAGAAIYYCASRYLERKGAAIRFPTRFREYALERKQDEAREQVKLLSKCDLLRHMPAQAIEDLLPAVHTRRLAAGEILFQAGDPGDALFIVVKGRVQIKAEAGSVIAELGDGQAFGEMALLSGGARTATAVPLSDVELLQINRADFDRMIANDGQLANAVQRLSHDRALKNLSDGVPNPRKWANVAISNVHHLSHAETTKLLTEAADGAGMAIIMGNVLDTIPGCLVIGANFRGLGSLSLTLMLGMFLGGIPEAAASAAMLTRAGFTPKKIFGLWSTVLVAGILAAAFGKAFISSPESLAAIFCEALAGGAVLALVAHAMFPEALHQGGSVIVLPTVAGFLFALYLSLAAAFA
jgi:zinc transporter ZupT